MLYVVKLVLFADYFPAAVLQSNPIHNGVRTVCYYTFGKLHIRAAAAA